MKTNKMIHDLGIAITIIAGVLMGLAFLGSSMLGFGSAVLGSTPIYCDDYYMNDYGFSYGYAFTDLLEELMDLFGTLSFGMLIFAIPALVAGIVAIRHCKEPASAKSIFGWALTGAICTAIVDCTLLCVLCIILCIFARQMKAKRPETFDAPVEKRPEPITIAALEQAAKPDTE